MSAKFPYRLHEIFGTLEPLINVRISFPIIEEKLEILLKVDSSSSRTSLPFEWFAKLQLKDGSKLFPDIADEFVTLLTIKEAKIDFLNATGEIVHQEHLKDWEVFLSSDPFYALGRDVIDLAVYTFVESADSPYFLIEEIAEHLKKQQELVTVREFNFPSEVRIACEQYLQYFAEFLSDIGISATTDIKHDSAGKVLFSVKPDNPKIALVKIREALQVYLELAGSPIADSTADENDPRVLMLRSEINTLKSRLDLAQVKIIEQEKRLELQEKLIQKQEEIDSLKESSHRSMQSYKKAQFTPEVLRESAVDGEIIEGEIIEESQILLNEKDTQKSSEIKDGDVDLKLVRIKPANIGVGLEINTPRLIKYGVRSLKELFTWADRFLNEE